MSSKVYQGLQGVLFSGENIKFIANKMNKKNKYQIVQTNTKIYIVYKNN